MKNRSFFVGNVKGYEMPRHRSMDIDDAFDMFVAEQILDHGICGF